MTKLLRFLTFFLIISLGLAGAGSLALYGAYLSVQPNLPDTEQLRRVELQVPLRIYTTDNQLIGEFGDQRRDPSRYDELPEKLVQAFISAEDDRFFEHPGVDWQGLARAVAVRLITGKKKQGGSTITMQVARNFFLTRKKTYVRKLNEMALSFQIEKDLSKQEILALYLNKIYLGQRAYGVRAAARIYYDKTLDQLSLPEIAMIASLPKAPSSSNPISNPKRAKQRRNYVLRRMHELSYISTEQMESAQASPVHAKRHLAKLDLKAPYVAEMVRATMVEQYGARAYSAGFKVYTSIDSKLQKAAILALRDGLLAYDRRHGYRGPEDRINPDQAFDLAARQAQLADIKTYGELIPAVVTDLDKRRVHAISENNESITIEWKQLSWARRFIDDYRRGRAPKTAEDIVRQGDIILVQKRRLAIKPPKGKDKTAADSQPKTEYKTQWVLAKIPKVQGAIVSLRPEDSAILALTGGFDFQQSKFNRATQALRQAGSGIKPFIYLAGLLKGLTPATLINDAPIVFNDSNLEGDWRPENYSGKFFGPTRLRVGLMKSRNLISIRVLRRIGIEYAAHFLESVGFPGARIPHNLSLALGTLSVSPLEVAGRYAILANGGYKTEPWLIERIENSYHDVLYQHRPLTACDRCPRPDKTANAPSDQSGTVITPTEATAPSGNPLAERIIPRQQHFLIYSMMQDVIRRGTARRARVLKRQDLAGKTGTTNDQQDAWFSGYNRDIVTSAWVGFDQIKPLGARETGGHAALPIWIDYMRVALKDKPNHGFPPPPGIVRVKIDPKTGQATSINDPKGEFEYFTTDTAPRLSIRPTTPSTSNDFGSDSAVSGSETNDDELLF